MRRRTALMTLSLAWASVDAEPLRPQSPEQRVVGVEVQLFRGPGERIIQGELLAVERDTLWVAGPGAARLPFPAGAMHEARVRTFQSAHTFRWVVLGWAATSVGLTVACQSYGESGCGAVPLGVAVPWVVVGGIAAAFRESRRWERHPASDLDALRAYARFPQGRPDP